MVGIAKASKELFLRVEIVMFRKLNRLQRDHDDWMTFSKAYSSLR